jgi:uncharacterized membrane protein YkoI
MISDFSQLPQVVSTTVREKYPGYTITSVNREFQKDRLGYEIEMVKDDSRIKAVIDANSGLVVKSKEKEK